MKKFYYLVILCVIFSSCGVSTGIITYENTNASLINKSIQNLDVVNEFDSYIKKEDKIAIVGLEDYHTSDYSLLVTLEDEIIKDFVAKGYNVLERDKDILYRMFSEEEKKYKHINRLKSSEIHNSASGSASSLYGSGLGGASVFKSKSSSGSITNYDQVYNSDLNTVDKLLSYRVIECGVIFNRDNKDAALNEVEREARTILEARLIDAKTSKILTAQTLDGKSSDFVDELSIRDLESFSYKYYSHTYPKKYGNPSKRTIINEAKKVGKGPIVIAAILGTTMLTLILGNTL